MNTHNKTLTLAAGLLFGVFIGYNSHFASEIAICAFLLFLMQLFLFFFDARRKENDKAGNFLFSVFVSLVSVGLFLGVMSVQIEEEKKIYVCEEACSFSAEIISSPESKNEYQVFTIRPDDDNDVYDIQVRSTLYPKYRIGDTFIFFGKVTIPKIILPHTNNTISFDYTSYLKTKNIGSEMMYPHIENKNIETVTVAGILGRIKESFVSRINMYVSQPASSLANGMLFGKSSLSDSLLQTFRVAGLSHIIVLSGFNIVIVITFILFIFRFLPLTIRILFAVVSVISFVMMVGVTPSIVRATLMSLISLFALFMGRQYVAKQALIISFLLIVMYDPYSLFNDVSLHLSFLATCGIIYMSDVLGKIYKKYFSRFVLLQEIMITSFSAYLATVPYVAFSFGKISVYALFANIVIVPLVPIVMLLSFFVIVASYFSKMLSSILGAINSFVIDGIIWFARLIESLPYSSFNMSISFQSMCIFYFFIFLSLKYISVKQKNETQVTREEGNMTDVISY